MVTPNHWIEFDGPEFMRIPLWVHQNHSGVLLLISVGTGEMAQSLVVESCKIELTMKYCRPSGFADRVSQLFPGAGLAVNEISDMLNSHNFTGSVSIFPEEEEMQFVAARERSIRETIELATPEGRQTSIRGIWIPKEFKPRELVDNRLQFCGADAL
jgi:hypothetical protein